jgi:RNA polymerase sigma-70 factor, ECF subfamily
MPLVSSGTFGARLRLQGVGRALESARVAEDPSDVDELTLARARRGDRQAFRALVERYERPVFALLGRMLFRAGRESLVEDLAQETFVRVFRGLPAFGADGRNNVGAWILTIAARLAIDELRRQQPHAVSLDADTLAVASPSATDEPSERRRVAAAIERAVAALGPEYRAAFLLREVHDMDYESIAEALRVDVGTVKSRLSRARAALRRALQGTYDER